MIVVVGCGRRVRWEIYEWVDDLRGIVNSDRPFPPKLRRLLRDALNDVVVIANTKDLQAARSWVRRNSGKDESSFYIVCCDDSLDACDTGDKNSKLRGFTRRDAIYLCKPGQNRTTLFHELIHLVGGTELDSEAYENTVLGWFSMSTDPTPDDFDKFVDESCNWRGLRATEFTIWDPHSGDKWTNTGTRDRPRKGRELSSNPPTPKKVLKRLEEDSGTEWGGKKKAPKKSSKGTGKKPPAKGTK